LAQLALPGSAPCMAAMEAPRCPNRLIACTHRIYEAGANKLDDVLDWCGELGIRAVTLCLFSTENLKRPADEVPGIFSASQGKLRKLANDPEIHRRRVRVKAMGTQPGGLLADQRRR
jgi:undecaprenyl diphosphate synthase